MYIEIYWLLGILSFFLLGLGIFLKEKTISFAGSTLILLIGLMLILPTSVNGGVEIATGTNKTVIYNYENISNEIRVANTTNLELSTYSPVSNAFTTGFGIIFILTGLYFNLMLFLGKL